MAGGVPATVGSGSMVESVTPTTKSIWWWVIGGCIVVRLAFPVAALAAEGSTFLGLPRFDYGQLYGDANGYYAASRELIAASTHVALQLVGLALLGVGGLYLAVRRRAAAAHVALVVATVAAAAATLVVIEMRPVGAPVVGWPLLWAVALAPLRLLDPGFGPDAAIAIGLALSFLALATTVVSIAYVGLYASGKRAVGLLAAVLFAAWPLAPGLVVGARAWENGTWLVDVGLALYTEPLSTALVIGAIALLLRPTPTDLTVVVAGLALGFATVVKLSDGLIAAGVIGVLLVSRRWRQALLVAVGGILSAPIVLAYWDKGYVDTYNGKIAPTDRPWSFAYVGASWGDSLLFSPLLITLLVVPAVVGAIALRTMVARALVVVPIVLTVALYSLYFVTALHPRFFFVVLPLVFVLDAAALVWLAERIRESRRPPPLVRIL